LLIAQALIAEAERRGWEVKPVEKSYNHRGGCAIVVRGHSYPFEISEMTDRRPLDEREFERYADELPHRYPCVMKAWSAITTLVDPRTGAEHLFEGRCTGTMAGAPRGSGGFGYDPIFIPDDRDDGRTMAELTQAEKDAISHRGRAARALLAHLERSGPADAAPQHRAAR
jgi:hypothetical protein